MSDMPRPRPLPSAADHEQHDALLVAQLAAGDALPDGQQRQAQQLVSACRSCSELAADLRVVSGAVAWEPVPPRRRDFRLDPGQAEELQGNAISRLLRRFSLPRSRAFQPAAAGLLSVGLVFIVAVYVWPEDGSITFDGEMNAVPAAVEERAEDALVPAGTEVPFGEILRSQGGAPFEDVEFFATEPLIDADADANVERSLDADVEPLLDADVEPLLDAESQLTQKSAPKRAGELAEEGLDDWADAAAGALPEAPAAADALTEAEPGLGMAESLEPDAVVSEDQEAVSEADDSVATGTTGELEAASQVVVDEGLDLESIVLVVGLGLALAGAVLLLLAWLARRTTDPLLR